MSELRIKIFVAVQVLVSVLTVLSSSAMADVVPPPFRLTSYKGPELESEFVSANEHFDALFEPKMKNMNGAAITTGTFRAFQRVLYGNLQWMFVIDINPRVTEFNKLNADAILNSTRREYLENFPITYLHNYGRFPLGYDSSSENYSDGKKRPLFSFLTYEEHFLDNPNDAIREHRPQDLHFINSLYYNTDAAYARLQQKLHSTKMVFLTNTMTSSEVAQKLAAFLGKQKIEVTLLDMSNIMDYVIKDRPASDQVAAFIRALPFAKNAQLFFTISLDRPTYQRLLGPEEVGRQIDTFRYYTTTPDRFLEIVEDKPKFLGEKPTLLLPADCISRLSTK